MIMELWDASIYTVAMSAFGGLCAFFGNMYAHNRSSRFDTAISKIYSVIEGYVECANNLRNNINSLSIDRVSHEHADELDDSITFPLFDLRNKTVMMEMFFDKKDREPVLRILGAAIVFNLQLGNMMGPPSEADLINMYDRARTKFNKEFNSAMDDFIEMIHSRLLGKWQGFRR